jgi:hypothetical protein
MKNFRITLRHSAMLFAIVVMPGASQIASAVEMSVYASKPSQWGTGSGYYHGHTVNASTDFNMLNAGGAFTVQCNHPATLLMTGERGLSGASRGYGKNKLTVTIPAQQPAVRNVSGWTQVPGDTTLSCNYRWTAYAIESGYSIGIAGISYQVGNGSVRDGNTIDFEMYRPPREDADGGCIP